MSVPVVLTQALLCQAMPPLTAKLSVDGTTWKTSITCGDGSFLLLRCEAPSTAAGGWYGALADASISTPEYFLNGGLPAMAVASVDFADAAEPYYAWAGQSYDGPNGVLDARPEDVTAFLVSRLGGPDYASFHSYVASTADPLYTPPPFQTFIQQDFCLRPTSEWEPEDSGAFSLDKILQLAVWRRVASSPELEGMTPDVFFGESAEWKAILDTPVALHVSLIGMRGPWVTSGVPYPATPPDLDGYPNLPPKLTISPSALISFVGTGVELSFYAPWTGFVPMNIVPAGGTVILAASGYRPDMQVLLYRLSAPAGQRYEITLRWGGFGEVAIPIDANTAPGTYEVRNYRYRTETPTGFVNGPWQTIAGGLRPRIQVQ